jgi:small-conductance mechanosensitive channel
MRKNLRRIVCLALLGLIFAVAVPQTQALAQSDASQSSQSILDNAQKTIDSWNRSFDQIEKNLKKGDVSGHVLAQSRQKLEDAISGTRDLESAAKDRLDRLNAALEKLGPKPEDGQAEVPAVTAERDRLNKEIARVSGLQKQGELANFRASELSDRVSRLSRDRFTRRIFGRVSVPLDPVIWQQAWKEAMHIPDLIQSRYDDLDLSGKVGDQLSEVAPQIVLLLFVIAAALVGGEVLMFRFLPTRWQKAPEEDRLALISGTRFVFSALVPGVLLFAIYSVLDHEDGLLTGSAGELINQCFFAALFLLFVGASIRSIFSPFVPEMRSVGTTETGARVVGLLALFTALVFASDIILLQGATTLGASLDLALVQSLSNIVLISILLFIMTLNRWWKHDATDEVSDWWRKIERRCRRGVRIVSILLPVVALIGYVALARFVLENMMLALAFATSYLLLREYFRALVHTYLVKPEAPSDDATSDAMHGTLYFWLRVIIDTVMLLIAVPLAIMVFTDIAWNDLIQAVEAAFVGIQIGSINISLRAILIAALLFLVLLSIMRFFQRMLNTRVLPNTKLDQGLQHSVSAIFGYAGISLAMLIAVSAAGVDLSNLAIIAGAISVGIGFGMQSIVNNFVSGLILLIERPIKVGDWIVVGPDQGFVKDIRVRATEIETFDRSSVVIPNSELISNRVMNWTLKDKSGRGIVKIGVAYGSDPNQVRDILLETVDKRREVLSYPAPQVVFMDFGASSLDFELRYFLRDIGDVLAVASALRFEILQRFREEGVEIPFPQQDLHLRDMDRLEAALRNVGLGGVRGTRDTDDAKGESPELSEATKQEEQSSKAAQSEPDHSPSHDVPGRADTGEESGKSTPATRGMPDGDGR